MAYRRWLDPACEITGGPRLRQKTTLIVCRRRVGDHKSSSDSEGTWSWQEPFCCMRYRLLKWHLWHVFSFKGHSSACIACTEENNEWPNSLIRARLFGADGRSPRCNMHVFVTIRVLRLGRPSDYGGMDHLLESAEVPKKCGMRKDAEAEEEEVPGRDELLPVSPS
jgi:hypothetical protein